MRFITNTIFGWLAVTGVLLLGSVLAKEDCSQIVGREFGFGASFSPAVAQLFNSRFPSQEICFHLNAFLWKELATFFDLNQWNRYEPATRRRLANQVIPLLHYRAQKAGLLGNSSLADKAIGEAFKSTVLTGNLFEAHDELNVVPTAGSPPPLPCSKKVLQALQVKKVFVAQLAAYIDGYDASTCNTLVAKLKSSMLELVRLSEDDWMALGDNIKLTLAESALPLLHIRESKHNGTEITERSERTWPDFIQNKLFLGRIFSDASEDVFAKAMLGLGNDPKNGSFLAGSKSANGWRTVLWLVLILCVGIALYLGLRYMDAIPSVA